MVQAQANADGRNASLWERAANAQGDLRTARIKAAAAYEVHAEWLEAAATAHEAYAEASERMAEALEAKAEDEAQKP